MLVEIICPNCGARYQVPIESLGADGRHVTCSVCGHVWLAKPPSPLPLTPPPMEPADYAPQPARAAPESGGDGERERKMAEFRQMLDEVQSTERRRGAPAEDERGYAAERWNERTAPVRESGRDPRRRASEDDDDGLLRERVATAKPARSRRRDEPDGEDVRNRLSKRHERRTRQREEEEKRAKGAGYSGLTLVALVAGVLTGLYAFAPEISAQNPEAGPALTNYVVAIDGLRDQIALLYSDVSSTVAEQLAPEEE
ncbi:MAG: zinc-ribbon domain-containing protein [Pseudomonadota bacterium]